jgi:hypothetical protein
MRPASESADENVVAVGEGALDKFEDRFEETRGFGFGKAEAALERTYALVFGESHGREPPDTALIWKCRAATYIIPSSQHRINGLVLNFHPARSE